MSHSTVLVIGEDPESMLIPYDENTEVEPHRSYVESAQPQDHYLFKTLVKEHGLDPDTADWPTFVTAYNSRYGGDEKLYYDSEMDRVYDMSTYNPLSRWDWYQLGGRWTGFFKLKPGAQGEVGSPGLMTPVSRVGWADQARKRMDAPLTFAILDQDGWHERGKMGWWGVVHDESSPDAWAVVANSIIDKAPDDALFSVYDVHI